MSGAVYDPPGRYHVFPLLIFGPRIMRHVPKSRYDTMFLLSSFLLFSLDMRDMNVAHVLFFTDERWMRGTHGR